MGVFSEANLFGMTIRESATDGSDFTNPDADYRRLFLGEDGFLHVKDSAGNVTDPYDITATAETWETAIGDLSGKVHRWKFEEASGDFNDEISTLDLVANGSISYSVASPLGNSVSFTGGFAESSGLGSIPTGDAARTVVIVWKKNAVGGGSVVPLFSYGAGGTRTLFEVLSTAITDIRLSLSSASTSLIVPFGDAEWHISAAHHVGTGAQAVFIYHDGLMSGTAAGGNLATSSANNFHVAAEFDDTDPATITVTDCTVFDRTLAKWELDRLYAALRAALA